MRGPVVVLGDTLLDRDVEGVVNRLCPDSPVPVLDETAASDRPGGAGLAAVFAAAQGAEVVLVTALADDAGGARLSALLAAAGVQVYPLALPGATPEKIRLRARGPGAAAPRPGRPVRGAGSALRRGAPGDRRGVGGAGQRLRPGGGPAARAARRVGRHPRAGGVGPTSARPGGGARRTPGHPERVGGARAGPRAARCLPAGHRVAGRAGATAALAGRRGRGDAGR